MNRDTVTTTEQYVALTGNIAPQEESQEVKKNSRNMSAKTVIIGDILTVEFKIFHKD